MFFLSDSIFTEPAIQLVNGEVVHITESKTFEIFIEDSDVPTLMRYDFTFTNIENQNIITSYVPNRVSTYELNAVRVGDEVVRGRFGRLIALVDFEPGSYEIYFTPFEGSGIFIWGTGVSQRINRFVIQVLIIALPFVGSLYIFIFLLANRGKFKQNEDGSYREEMSI